VICRNSSLPKVGLEPTPTCVDRILSPARLPFRHFGCSNLIGLTGRIRDHSLGDKRARCVWRMISDAPNPISRNCPYHKIRLLPRRLRFGQRDRNQPPPAPFAGSEPANLDSCLLARLSIKVSTPSVPGRGNNSISSLSPLKENRCLALSR
jgi:hypothetical protein